ncbi:hypothetical protein HBE96_00305 [Clostridium sp. P21]|uniref:Uncharacterized protein n=1 Tax=Clostridium muellerianum TaxID=2716538 RepID=A0A7Y0ED17_9CLOT|nr:hypothetical protein [Clostridium muellerianum]NMM61168.1 hypothetical protein [Clostridium muellerianum]
MESIRKIEKLTIRDVKEIGLDYKIVERVIEEKYIHSISIEELVHKISLIANSDNTMMIVEVLGVLRIPPLLYESESGVEVYIEKDDSSEKTFILASHDDDIGNFEFDALEVKAIIWDRWNGCFLIRFIENDIEIMISYLDYNFWR